MNDRICNRFRRKRLSRPPGRSASLQARVFRSDCIGFFGQFINPFAVPNRDRMILGEALVDVVLGSAPCHDCLLFNTQLCRGGMR
jgi:hypothetical protein